MRDTGQWLIYDVGEEIHPGYHVGDRIKYRGYEYFVSNLKDISPQRGGGDSAYGIFVYTHQDPNGYKRLRKPLHGGWVAMEENLELIECLHPDPPSDEEIAALFGVGLDALPKKRAARKKKVVA